MTGLVDVYSAQSRQNADSPGLPSRVPPSLLPTTIMPKVFLITGCSSGFGKEYVEEVLKRGDIAVATARKPESLKFKGANDQNLLALRLDVNDQSSIDKAFEEALKKFGRVDVVSLVHIRLSPCSQLAAGLQ
jgi:hypothetical protein